MDKRCTLSVLIPVYNVESYIRPAVVSLFVQHDPRVEYVFVNDRSTDNSWKVLKNVLAEYPEAAASARLLEHERNGEIGRAHV